MAGNFTFNNIELLIPPEAIQIQRNTVNNYWNTLRTKSSIKTRSGYSKIDIMITAKFTDSGDGLTNGFSQLRDIVSQVRTTPFVWVENEYLRTAILGNAIQQSMVLALKNLEIHTIPGVINAVEVFFKFAWFNYKPFTKDYAFTQDLFVPMKVNTPAESKAWSLLYKAEQDRGKYDLISQLSNDITFDFDVFANVEKAKEKTLTQEINALQEIQQSLSVNKANLVLETSEFTGGLTQTLTNLLNSTGLPKQEVVALGRQIADSATSMLQNQQGPIYNQQLADALQPTIKSLQSQLGNLYAWQEVETINPGLDGNGTVVEGMEYDDYEGELLNQSNALSGNERLAGLVLMRKRNRFNLNDLGLIPTSISISFENILATLPVIGHPYPTYQHIGSIDAIVTLGLTTTRRSAVASLANIYSMLEDQSRKARLVPMGLKNIRITNSLINMCGIHEMIIENMAVETVPGTTDTSNVQLTLVDNPLDATVKENLNIGEGFLTNDKLRWSILDILNKNIKFDADKIKATSNTIDVANTKVITKTLTYNQEGNPQVGVVHEDENRKRLYSYTGNADDQHFLFKTLTQDYANHLSETLDKLIGAASVGTNQESLGNLYKSLPALFTLTDNQVPGIERMQRDLVTIFTSSAYEPIQAIFDRKKEIPLPPLPSREVQLLHSQQLIGNDAWTADDINKARSAVDLYNQLKQAEAPSDDSLRNAAMADVKAFRMENESLISSFVYKYLRDYQSWAINFLDTISRTTDLMDIPEFAGIKEQILKSAQSSKDPDCYPDFPLTQVIAKIKGNKTYSTVLQSITDAYFTKQLNLSNVNISSIINPDFYIYPDTSYKGTDNDGLMMNKVASAINLTHTDARLKEESTWLDNQYKALVGVNAYEEVNKSAGLTDSQKGKHDIIASDLQNAPDGAIISQADAQKLQAAINATLPKESDYFAPDTLQGSFTSAIQSSIEIGKSITIQNLTGPLVSQISPGSRSLAMNIRDNESKMKLKVPQYAATVKHTFSTSPLDPQGEQAYRPNDTDINKKPSFSSPISGAILKPMPDGNISNGFGDVRELRNNKPHTGIDIAKPVKTPVLAAGDGKVIKVIGLDPNAENVQSPMPLGQGGYTKVPEEQRKLIPEKSKEGQQGWTNGSTVEVHIQHTNKDYVTVYKHLTRREPIIQKLFNALHPNVSIDQSALDYDLTVHEGQQIGEVNSTGYSTGNHLHFEVREKGRPVNPLEFLPGGIGYYKSQGPLGWIDPDTESLFTKSMEQFDKGMNSQGYSMMRAYPTFKLFFIESDLGERRYFQFDDFFSYSAVQDITVIRNRKIAADLCIIKLTNVSGVLSNRKWKEAPDPTGARTANGDRTNEDPGNPTLTNTSKENAIASMMLQPGVQIQLRLGYSNAVDELETVFNGTIAEVNFSGTDDMVEIVCQSYGIELVQQIYGEAKKFGNWFSSGGRTAKILEELIAAPEVVHFGRWELTGNSGQKTALNKNIYGLLSNRWQWKQEPAEDNIFAPQGTSNAFLSLEDQIEGFPYTMYQTTIWDVFQEMTLRHPGYIALPVPYKGKFDPGRMTLFFGVPDQFYFARDPTDNENLTTGNIKSFVENNKNGLKEFAQLVDPSIDVDLMATSTVDALNEINNARKDSNNPASIKSFQKMQELTINDTLARFAQNQGLVKPFRNYHVVTSTQHILKNEIQSSRDSTFNGVTLSYQANGYLDPLDPGANGATLLSLFKHPVAEIGQQGTLEFTKEQEFTLFTDLGIPDEDKREMFARYYNCVGVEMAKRYCISLLANTQKEGYKGSLVIIGNPTIKPYDIVYVLDEYTDMYGPVEVEQVVHRFSQDTGFITEITPNMCVHVNQASTMSTMDAMGAMAEYRLKQMGMESLPSLIHSMIDYGPSTSIDNKFESTSTITLETADATKSVAGTVALAGTVGLSAALFGTAAAAIGTIGILGGILLLRKGLMRTQTKHPIRYSPLTIQGMPMLGGIPARKIDGFFICDINLLGLGRWLKDKGRAMPLQKDALIDRMHPNYWISEVGKF